MGRRHGCTALGTVLSIQDAAVDVDARGRNIQGSSVVGEGGPASAAVRSAYGDGVQNVGRAVGHGVAAVISGRNHHGNSLGNGVPDRVIHIVAVSAAQAQVNYIRAMVRRILDAHRHAQRSAATGGSQHPHRHDLNVQLPRTVHNGTGDMGAVAVLVLGSIIIFNKVKPNDFSGSIPKQTFA